MENLKDFKLSNTQLQEAMFEDLKERIKSAPINELQTLATTVTLLNWIVRKEIEIRKED